MEKEGVRNGQPKIRYNIFAVEKEMEPVLQKFQKELPASIAYEKSFNNAQSVHTRLSHFTMDFVIAIFLVLLTLLPLGPGFRRRHDLHPPVSGNRPVLTRSLPYYDQSVEHCRHGRALGLLVDDSIVVVENIERYLRMGYGKKEAAMAATRQIGRPLSAAPLP